MPFFSGHPADATSPVPDATVEGVQALRQQKFAMQAAHAKVAAALRCNFHVDMKIALKEAADSLEPTWSDALWSDALWLASLTGSLGGLGGLALSRRSRDPARGAFRGALTGLGGLAGGLAGHGVQRLLGHHGSLMEYGLPAGGAALGALAAKDWLPEDRPATPAWAWPRPDEFRPGVLSATGEACRPLLQGAVPAPRVSARAGTTPQWP